MKVQELRATMKGAPPTFLQNALVEAYKLIPKAKKDEADEKIRAILQGEAPPAKPAPKKPEVIFSDLSQDIETFLENAYDQNYFAPNRTVPKAQRSRWRFTVKRFFADLEKISPDSPDYPAAADLYARLYAVLCEGCQMWLFSSDDPFKSIESSQEDLFTRLGHYVLQSGCTEENLRLLIPLACREGHSRESWSGSIQRSLLELLENDGQRNLALEITRELCQGAGPLPCGTTEVSRSLWVNHNVCQLLMSVADSISEEVALEEAKVFFREYDERNREIALYVCLRSVSHKPTWVRLYEYGLSLGISPREELRNRYQDYTAQES